jgi:hypothetical protein
MAKLMTDNFEESGGFGSLGGGSFAPPQTVRELLRQEVEAHARHCRLSTEQIPERLRQIEIKLATLLGLMLGAGTLGGTVGAAIIKLLP